MFFNLESKSSPKQSVSLVLGSGMPWTGQAVGVHAWKNVAMTQLDCFLCSSLCKVEALHGQSRGWTGDDEIMGYLLAAIAVGLEVSSPSFMWIRDKSGDASIKLANNNTMVADFCLAFEEGSSDIWRVMIALYAG